MGCPCGERKVSEREETDCRESMKLESPQNERYNMGMGMEWFHVKFFDIKFCVDCFCQSTLFDIFVHFKPF